MRDRQLTPVSSHAPDGVPFDKLDRDALLHRAEVKAYESGMLSLRYETQRLGGKPQSAS